MNGINVKVVWLTLSLPLSGCISSYHAWDGVKGYQEDALSESEYRVSYVAEQATRWTMLDGYLARRCRELLGQEQVRLEGVQHDVHSITVMSSATIGSPVISGDQVTMPVTSAPHEVVFNLRKAEGHCSIDEQ